MECITEGCNNKRYRRHLVCGPCRHSKRRYGLDTKERSELLVKQNNKCKLCETSIEFNGKPHAGSAVVDHDHNTGNIRGILCVLCNRMIGQIEHHGVSLNKIEKYLLV